MAANEIHVNDIGTVFTVTIKDGSSAVNISTASQKDIMFRKPSGTCVSHAAAFVSDGTDGKIQYTVVSGDLDESGTYKLQSYVKIGSGEWYTDTTTFKVHKNIC